MQLKKLFFNIFLLTTMTTIVYGGDFRVPLDRDGKKANTIKDAYVRVVSTGYVTSASMLIRGATIAIHGVLTSTLPAGSAYAGVEMRSTDTANTSSELLIPPLRISSETRNTLYVFDPPILCPGGLSVNLTSAGTFVSVFYNYSATSTKSDFFIPFDMDNVKASSDFYGVKVASVVAVGAAADVIGTESLDNTTGEKIVIAERSLFYGMMAGSVTAVSSYVVYEDTASTLGDPKDIFPPLFFNVFNVDSLTNTGENSIIKFPWPILFSNGIGVTNSSANERIRVFARPARNLR